MKLNRRRALSLLGVAGAAAPALAEAQPVVGSTVFQHGVASGDPTAGGVILWTRVTTSGAASPAVDWEISESPDFGRIVSRGRATTSAARDFTVKVEAGGLKPGRDYVYRFRSGGTVSPVGRARTLPTGATDKVVLGVVTCALYPGGYFSAYEDLAKSERLDAVIELGDYIYEYGAKDGDYGMAVGKRLNRIPDPPHEILSLADYRRRYAQYRSDPDLQAAHARAAWICVWDDHEVCNDSYVSGAENHDPKTEGAYSDRKRVALQAYFEWMPIREPRPGAAREAVSRSFRFGDLASLHMVESRLAARTRQVEVEDDVPHAVYSGATRANLKKVVDPAVSARVLAEVKAGRPVPAGYVVGPDMEVLERLLADPSRQMLGAAQEAWLGRELKASMAAGVPWQVIGNQTVMAKVRNPDVSSAVGPARLEQMITAAAPELQPRMRRLVERFKLPSPYGTDAWNGYPAARERTLQAVRTAGQGNTVVLAGDSHAFWTNQLSDASGLRVAAELGSSAITSPSLGDYAGFQIGAVIAAQNDEVVFNDQQAKGYLRLTITPDAFVGEMIGVDHLKKPYASKAVATWRLTPTKAVGVGAWEKVA